MLHGFRKYSHMRQRYFLDSTCDMDMMNKQQRYATLAFYILHYALVLRFGKVCEKEREKNEKNATASRF